MYPQELSSFRHGKRILYKAAGLSLRLQYQYASCSVSKTREPNVVSGKQALGRGLPYVMHVYNYAYISATLLFLSERSPEERRIDRLRAFGTVLIQTSYPVLLVCLTSETQPLFMRRLMPENPTTAGHGRPTFPVYQSRVQRSLARRCTRNCHWNAVDQPHWSASSLACPITELAARAHREISLEGKELVSHGKNSIILRRVK